MYAILSLPVSCSCRKYYHFRGGEILYSLAVAYSRHLGVTTFPEQQLMKQLVNARRGLGLYQHHDGITGTAKDPVVADYGQK